MSTEEFEEGLFEEFEKSLAEMDEGFEELSENRESEKKNIIEAFFPVEKRKRYEQIGNIFMQSYMGLMREVYMEKKPWIKEFMKPLSESFERMRDSIVQSVENVRKFYKGLSFGDKVLYASIATFLVAKGYLSEFWKLLKGACSFIWDTVSKIGEFTAEVFTSDEVMGEAKSLFTPLWDTMKSIKGVYDGIVELFKVGSFGEFFMKSASLGANFVSALWDKLWGLLELKMREIFFGPTDNSTSNEIGVNMVVNDYRNLQYAVYGIEQQATATWVDQRRLSVTGAYSRAANAEMPLLFLMTKPSSEKKNVPEFKNETKEYNYEGLIGEKTRKEYLARLSDSNSDVLLDTIGTFLGAIEQNVLSKKQQDIKTEVVESYKKRQDESFAAIYGNIPTFTLDEKTYSTDVREPMVQFSSQEKMKKAMSDAGRTFLFGLAYALSPDQNRGLVARTLFGKKFVREVGVKATFLNTIHEIHEKSVEETPISLEEYAEHVDKRENGESLLVKETEHIGMFNFIKQSMELNDVKFSTDFKNAFLEFCDTLKATFKHEQIAI